MKKQVSPLLAAEPCNTGRQQEVDLGKALAVLFLPFVHMFIECTPADQFERGLPFLFDYVIGGPISAPMFLFAMGIGIEYSARRDPRSLARRGLKLLGIGFLLNLCRYLIPLLTGWLLTHDAEQYLTGLPYKVLGNDILQFAGLALLVIALLRHWKLSAPWMLLTAFGLCLAGWACNDVDLGSPVRNVILGHFIGTEDAEALVVSDFPLLNWLLIPVSGMVFGGVLRRVRDKDAFYRRVSPIPLLVSVVFLTVEWYFGFGMNREGGENTYYHATSYDILAFICFTVGMLGLHQGLQRFLPKPAQDFMVRISRATTSIYCVHWVLVVWISNVLLYILRGTQVLPAGWTLLLSLAILLTSIAIAQFWQTWKRRLRRHEE